VHMNALIRRLTLAAVVALALPVAAVPAEAAALRTTHVTVAVTPATVHVGGVVLVSGSVTPLRSGAQVTLQRFVGKTWKTLAHQKTAAPGTYAFHLKTPKSPTTWVLRVSRAAGGGDKAGVSKTQHIHVVKPVYAVTASAALGTVLGQVVVSGNVSPHGTGKVQLQEASANTWITVATATLGTSSTYSATATLAPAASYTLRVVKPFSTTTAQGVSKRVQVSVPPPNPVVATTSLPKAVIGRAYSTTLTATLGTTPYTWSATGLPAGLTLSAAGVLTGTTVLPGSFPLTVIVTDSGGRTGSAALTFTVAQTSVVGWGYNVAGQLGDGTTTTRLTPVPALNLNAVTGIAGNASFVLAVRTDGSVWGWGDNEAGELGMPATTETFVPLQVPGLSSITAVAAGQQSGYALASDGTVWAMGDNSKGQLGNGTTTTSRIPVQVSGLSNVVAIAASVGDGYALTRSGTVFSWGDNTRDQLGNGTPGGQSPTPVQVSGLVTVTAIGTTFESGYALLADGTVRTWGGNTYGELGDGSLADSPVPVQPTGLTGVTALANGEGSDAYAIRADGSVWAWGSNDEGTVGDGTTTDRRTPVPVPALTGVTSLGAFGAAYAVLRDGTVRAWGEGSNGQLGNGKDDSQPSPIVVPGLSGVLQTAGCEASGFAIVTD
jgi:alpha-tubulin suppressor-like RCC1 family protein